MMIKGKFDGTSFEFSESVPANLNSKCEGKKLYNKHNLLFLEDRYIKETKFFLKIIQFSGSSKIENWLSIRLSGIKRSFLLLILNLAVSLSIFK